MRITDQTVPETVSATNRKIGMLAGIHQIPFHGGAILRLNPRALQRLDFLVREGLNTQPYSIEAGGILIGTVAPDHSVVRLEDVIAVKSEHRFGPSYRPSDEDLRGMAAAITENSEGARCVIGYFRSHLQENVSSLRREDEHLLQRFFAETGCAVILVQPNLDGQTNALFCQWDGGEGVRLLERIPLVRRDTQGETNKLRPVPVPERRGGMGGAGVAAPPRLRIGRVAPGADFLAQSIRRPLIAAGAAIALLSVFALGRFTGPHKTAPPPVALDLTVEGHGASIDVKWNADSPAIDGSERGSLDFVDGADFKRVELNQTQLRTGHYVYVPKQNDLTCLMTVYRNQNVFVGETKSVHLDALKSAPVAAQPGQSTAAPHPAEDLTASKAPPAPVMPIAPKTEKNKPPEKTSRTGLPSGSKKAVAQKAPAYARGAKFTPPPARDGKVPAPNLEDPPKLGLADANPVASTGLITPPLVDSSFTAATPISRWVAVLPPAAKAAIHQEVSIRVAVTVNRDGHVTGAHPVDVDAGDPLEKLLAPYAVKAARRWRFSPARRNGVPVASETVIPFRFTRN